jgi:hypothetical protein
MLKDVESADDVKFGMEWKPCGVRLEQPSARKLPARVPKACEGGFHARDL